MKAVKAYSIEEEIINCVREFAWALNKSQSQLVEDFIKQGIPKINSTIKTECDKKRQAVEEILMAIKQSRNKHLLEVGERDGNN